jgi:hypothetical protein
VIVFEEKWLEGLRKKYPVVSQYTAPFIAKLAFDPVLLNQRNKIEEWFKPLPDNAKPDICQRLRSEVSQQHFGAYYEILLYQFLRSLGYSADLHPELNGFQPDLLIMAENLNNPIIVEVATIFDDPHWQKEERKFNLILDELSKINHYFLVNVVVESEFIPENVDYARLNEFVIRWLDSFDTEKTRELHETEYKVNALHLNLTMFPLRMRRKSSIIGAHSLPVRWIESIQLKRVLQKKINKYKIAKKLNWPFLIAVSLTDAPLDRDDIVDELFGKMTFNICRDQKGHVVNTKWKLSSNGLITPKPGLGGKARNTRLSAVIDIKSKWLERAKRSTLAKRAYSFSIIHNPYASAPLNIKFLKGYPQFMPVAEDDKSISMTWIDNDSQLTFSC